MKNVITRRPLVAYFVLAYAGSWLFWAPLALSRNGIGLLPFEVPAGADKLLNTVALFAGPFAAALIVTKLGGGSVRRLLRRIVQVRAKPLSYVLVFLAIPVALAVAVLTQPAGPSGPPPGAPAGIPAAILVPMAFVMLILGGPLEEEPGWRGFALPHLQRTLSPVSAALALGGLWAAWHLPQFLIKAWDTPHQTVWDVLAFLLFAFGASVVLSWVANAAKGSILLPILGHNAMNWAPTVVPGLFGRALPSMWPISVAMAVLAVVCVIASKARLGVRSGSELTLDRNVEEHEPHKVH